MAKQIWVVWLLLAMAIAGTASDAMAAKKKANPPAAPAATRAMYAAPMRVVIVQNDRGCGETCPQWIAAEGEITDATPAVFARVFRQIGNRKLPVLIRSPGGSINAAFEIGRMIRKRGLDVAVGYTTYYGCAPDDANCKLPEDQRGIYRGRAAERYSWCNSACHLILAAGTQRYAAFGSMVGVHQPRTVWTRENIIWREQYKIVNGKKKVLSRTIVSRKPAKSKVTYGMYKSLRKQFLAYYAEMGIDKSVLDEGDKATYQRINYLMVPQLEKFRMRTSPESVVVLFGNDICRKEPAPAYCQPLSGKPTAEQKKETRPTVPAVTSVLPVGTRSGDMSFTLLQSNSPACTSHCPQWIVARGRITTGTVDRLQTLLKNLPTTPKGVMLDSLGGDEREAMKLGQALRDGGLVTLIGISGHRQCREGEANCVGKALAVFEDTAPPLCQFECALAFMGGATRIMDKSSTLVFNGLVKRKEQVPGQIDDVTPRLEYLQHMGVSPQALKDLVKSSATPLDAKHALATGAATTTVKSIAVYFEPSSCGSKSLGIFCSN